MAPTSTHTLLSRNDDPSFDELGELFDHLTATPWGFLKLMWFAVPFTLVVSSTIFVVGWWILNICTYVLKGGSPREKAGAVDAEELRRLNSHDGELGEGSVGGETLVEDEEDEDEDDEEVEDEDGYEDEYEYEYEYED